MLALRATRLSEQDLHALEGLVAAGGLRTDDRSRLSASVGAAYIDLARLRRGDAPELADAVVEPSTSGEVESLLQWADRERVAVVPRSGGTSVVGGVDPLENGHRAVIVASVRRLSHPGVVRPEQRTATFEAGTLGPEVEAQLRRHGLTLGHYPQSFERSAVGGWLAALSFGQASTRYHTPADRLVGFTIATPRGMVRWDRGGRPPDGPDPGALVPGSEGTLGILVDATLRVELLPQATRWGAALFSTWEAGTAAVRRLVSTSPLPAVVRLSDGSETDLTLAESGWEAGGRFEFLRRILSGLLGFRSAGARMASLLVVSYEGTPREVRLGSRFLDSVRKEYGAAKLPQSIGRAWERSRFRTPYLRDDLVEAGWFVETFETYVPWSHVAVVARAGREAVRTWADRRAIRAYVGAHLSHSVAEGTSLYFTVIAPQKTGEEEVAWQEFKRETAEAVVGAGGTVTHHHGIGRYHRPWVQRSWPAWRLEGLKALKARWDPNDIMNPGKLLPEA